VRYVRPASTWLRFHRRNVSVISPRSIGSRNRIGINMSEPGYRRELPVAGHALELMNTPIDETDAGAGHEVGHGSGREHLTGLCLRTNPRTDVHADTAERVAPDFDFAGVHTDPNVEPRGPDRVAEISRASVIGVLVTGLMRVLLFLAVLGVVAAGVRLDPSNPAASAFEAAAGAAGRRVFGLILWAAAITSVIGASYTSVSFLVGTSERFARRRNLLVVAFVGLSATVFLTAGAAPVPLLVFAGAFNGLILPLGIAVLLWVASRRPDLMGGYAYPRHLAALGLAAWLVTIYLGWESLGRLATLFR
jgi:hypothetical protein